MNQITTTFLNNLPLKPYCSEDLRRLDIRTREIAQRKKYIQHNHPDWLTCLVFDIDKDAYSILEDTKAKPNLAVFNRAYEKRDRAHFTYILEAPINTGSNGRLKPIRYVKMIEDALTLALRADPQYVSLITKNPIHQDHIAYTPNTQLWTLDHLADYLHFDDKRTVKREVSAHSRHCHIFDLVRFKAYEIVKEYREAGAFEVFQRTLTAYAEEKNCFPGLTPLPYSSIKSTVKSVSNWTWRHYTGNGETINRGRDKSKITMLDDLKDKQAYSAIITNQQRTETTQSKLKAAVRRLQARSQKITQQAVAEQSGLGIATVKRYWKELKVEFKPLSK